MKSASVLNVLMYLFRNHVHEGFDSNSTQKKLLPQLEEAGFDRVAIYSAFNWLEQLTQKPIKAHKPLPNESLRIYSSEEQAKLDADCRGYLLTLEHCGILKPHLREKVITQSLALEEKEGIDIHLIKWVTLLVLFTQPEEKNALAYMEHLVLNEATTVLQ